jgi:hypothetical protein
MALNGRISTFGTSSKKINYQNKISGKGQDLALKSTVNDNNGLGAAPNADLGYGVSPTPSVSVTPTISVTPSVSVTPSITPTKTPSPSA